MDWKHLFEEFKQLSPVTQVALVVFMLAMVLLLSVYPASGTSIITFLVALKMLAAR
jgi:hypothetical protein